VLNPAPLRVRTPAFLCDQLVVLLLGVVPVLATGVSVQELIEPGDLRRNVFILLMGIAFVYHFLLEYWTGQTVGKRLFGLVVVQDSGAALGILGSLLRNALRLIDGLGYWSVAVVVIVATGSGKRLGDYAGGTLVVRVGETDR
jgi:uncharacterized RDD family membrane protein YckC